MCSGAAEDTPEPPENSPTFTIDPSPVAASKPALRELRRERNVRRLPLLGCEVGKRLPARCGPVLELDEVHAALSQLALGHPGLRATQPRSHLRLSEAGLFPSPP